MLNKTINSMIFLFGIIFLAGCQTLPTSTALWYKTGSTIYTKQVDFDQCKIQSLKEIPQSIGTNFTPGISSPGTTYCNSSGIYGGISCNTYGGFDIPATVESYDMNDGLRQRYIGSCMAKRGYTEPVLPYCKDGEVGYSNTDPAPILSKIQCIDRKNSLGIQ
jgi:hypothetical protein